jgi:hypothetical protein
MDSITLLTLALVIVTLYYAILNHKSINLGSKPCLLINKITLSIYPEIKGNLNIHNEHKACEHERFQFKIDFTLTNIGNNPAQNIFLDSFVYFKTLKPFSSSWLPVDKPTHIDFLAPRDEIDFNNSNRGLLFDGYSSHQIIRDFFISRKSFGGLGVLMTRKEMKKKCYWPSPKILLKCYYKDIQGINYRTSYELFFHLSQHQDKSLVIYPLNMDNLHFLGVKRLFLWSRDRYILKTRNLRYSSFWGQPFKKKELVLLVRSKKVNTDCKIPSEK